MLHLIKVFSVIGFLILIKNVEPLIKEQRIISGRTSSVIDHPYVASLQRYGQHFCGGSILNNLWILTAGHCLEKTRPDQADGITIMMGSSDWSKGGVYIKVEKFYMHPKYNPQVLAYDLAVIKLASPVTFSASIKPINMATEQPKDGTRCVVSGWGFTNSRVAELEYFLRSADVLYLSTKVCASPSYLYGTSLKETMVCGEGNGTDACQGDSGGPLVDAETQKLVGVVSWGYDCGLRGYPGIYTNVAQLQPWVMGHLREW